jgi:hypothetical protein
MKSVYLGKVAAKRVALGLVLSQMLTLQASSSTGVAEAAAAALSIPARVAARHCAYKNSVKAAAVLNLTADTITICRDVLYFWNQSQDSGHRRDSMFTDAWGYAAINGAMTVRDLTKWGHHLGECMGLKSTLPTAVDDEFADFDDEVATANQVAGDAAAANPEDQEQDEQKISKLAYAWQVIALPSLEGLSAFAVAVTQQGATDWCAPACETPLRQIATAAHAFVRLLDERTMLTPGSKKAKVLDALLMVSALWLAYEIITYSQLSEPVPPVVHGDVKTADTGGGKEPIAATITTGTKAATTTTSATASAPAQIVRVNDTSTACRICMDDFDAHNKVALDGCGHAFCRGCLRQAIVTADREKQAAAIRCPQHREGCHYVMGERDIRAVLDEKDPLFATLMASYLDASLAKGAVAIPNMRHCPTPNCKYIYWVDPAAERLPFVCPDCNHDYCPFCLQAFHDPAQRCAAPTLASGSDHEAEFSAWLRENTRECPQCHTHIQKNNGCNHMTCRCGHQFCWLCSQPCFNPSEHFQVGHCSAATADRNGASLWISYHDEDKGGELKISAQADNKRAAAQQSQTNSSRPAVAPRGQWDGWH